jgi:RHH-type proline utilization regulon transcriptional repressor/proline dehydrogenase/delta 1-pyrroline-5-carboxylate dehydrogenase
LFTGSTDVARLIQRQLAGRLLANGKPIPLIAETGGQNAMIVDSSALPEQVVADVIASAFDSAGQRCSALRILCLQEDIADRTLAMLKGALQELRIGNTDRIAIDIGPVITDEAKANIERHIAAMRASGHQIEQLPLPPETANGTFVPPTIIELKRIAELESEVFGPVLHVIRYKRAGLDALIESINATGYGLTFGLHTRLDATVAHVTSRVKAGNLYVNRNIIGAVVGVQPFGGRGLSGTGPKAGGPLYLGRLVQTAPGALPVRSAEPEPALQAFIDWLIAAGERNAAETARRYGAMSPLGLALTLPGPVGETNLHALHARGAILLRPETAAGLYQQIAAILATGNRGVVQGMALPAGLPQGVTARLIGDETGPFAGALIEGLPTIVKAALAEIADLEGPVLLAQSAAADEMAQGPAYRLDWLIEEVSTSINTTAAGGNASLMAIG